MFSYGQVAVPSVDTMLKYCSWTLSAADCTNPSIPARASSAVVQSVQSPGAAPAGHSGGKLTAGPGQAVWAAANGMLLASRSHGVVLARIFTLWQLGATWRA